MCALVLYLEHEMQFFDPNGLCFHFAVCDPVISLDHN